ncbi:MAG: hypothetical protein NTU44_12605 [Bacteroidetes bacterium]|nr:hypothetical protein [Bacteroidota bacterium]
MTLKKKERFGLVLLGVFLGLVISLSVMWWHESIFSTEWVSFEKIRKVWHQLGGNKDDVLTQVDRMSSGSKHSSKDNIGGSVNPGSQDARLDSILMYDSLGQYYSSTNNALEYYIDVGDIPDSLRSDGNESRRRISLRDSSIRDSIGFRLKGKEVREEIAVKRDQFRLAKMLKVNGLRDTVSKISKNLDSLLTNDVNTKRFPANVYRVEFWKSPINYTGYRMYSNRIILFGNFDPAEISLEFISRKLYLHYRSSYYLLENTDNFQALSLIKKP